MLKKLTNGFDPLYLHPRWGAVSLEQAAYMDGLAARQRIVKPRPLSINSVELEQRNERGIDEIGHKGNRK